MKKINAMLASFLMAILAMGTITGCKPTKDPHVCGHVCPKCGFCADENCEDPVCVKKCICVEPVVKGRHMIVDKYGDFGGNLDKGKYGVGAPLNGKYDKLDSDYYNITDYYYVGSTDTRKIIKNFEPYQQTTEFGDGVACYIMMLNYMGVKLTDEYSEEALMEKYKIVNGAGIEREASTEAGMVKLIKDAGYTATRQAFTPSSTNVAKRVIEFTDFIKDQLDSNNFVMVRYQDGIRFQWHLVIGVDDMGSNLSYTTRDNVMIMADPCDDSDHCQDGYNISSISRFMKWWCRQDSTEISHELECITVHSKKIFDLGVETTDSMKSTEQAPERHLLLNHDGSFGGTLDEPLYGTIEEKNGFVDETLSSTGSQYKGLGDEHTDYKYFKYPDYYNMDTKGTRLLLPKFRVFEQTEASSCGICSVLNTVNYYGYDFSDIQNNKFIKQRQSLFDKGAKPDSKYNYWHARKTPEFGAVKADGDWDYKQEALTLIYMAQDSSFSSGTKLFNNYGGVGASKLVNVPKALGYTNSKYTNASKYHGVFPTYKDFSEWVVKNLKANQSMCTGWCPVSGHWTTIIGFDDMGTDYIYDDVIIIADSHDVSDHYQDGYNTYPANVFWGQWRNGGGTVFEQYVVVTRN